MKTTGYITSSRYVLSSCIVKLHHITVWRAQPWLPSISSIQVFDRFLTRLIDRMIKTFFCPLDLCLFSGDVIGSSEINSHQTCKKPVLNLSKAYAGWPRLDAQDCKSCLRYISFCTISFNARSIIPEIISFYL